MLVKIESKYKKFNDYFLEADEDEAGATSSNYSMKPEKKGEDDYNAIEPDDPSVLDDGDVSVLDDADDTDNDSYSDMEPDEEAEDNPEVLNDTDGNPDGPTEVNNNDDASILDDADDTDNDSYSDMEPDEEAEDNPEENQNEGQEDNGGDDVAVLDDDQNTDDVTSDNNDNTNDDQSNSNKEPVISEAHKKFYLYQKFVSMYNYINKYINKLQVSSYNDIYYTSIIKLSLNKLTILKKALYEYLMIKFDKVSYVEAYVFYETCYNIMKLSIDLLQNTVDNLKQ